MFVVVMAGGVMLGFCSGMPLVDRFFCFTLSARVEYGSWLFGINGLSGNYSLVLPGKWVLAFCMLVGRLELYTPFYSFSHPLSGVNDVLLFAGKNQVINFAFHFIMANNKDIDARDTEGRIHVILTLRRLISHIPLRNIEKSEG